jgi:hypothetical protein
MSSVVSSLVLASGQRREQCDRPLFVVDFLDKQFDEVRFLEGGPWPWLRGPRHSRAVWGRWLWSAVLAPYGREGEPLLEDRSQATPRCDIDAS